MTKNTSHANCQHPATKSERAKCRAAKKANAADTASQIAALKASYYDNSRDRDEIIYDLRAIDESLVEGYYDNTLDVEEIIAAL